MFKMFKYRIYPNKTMRKNIDQTIWLCRNLYNAALNERIDEYQINQKSLTYKEQANSLPFLKEENLIFASVYSQVLQDVLKRLDKTYQSFFRRVKNGETAGFPRFKGVDRYNSFTYPQGGYEVIKGKLKLSKIGQIKIVLHRPLEGTVKTCTIIRKNGKYYACFSCEVETKEQNLVGGAVGIDMGLKEFCVTSDGEMIENPRSYRKAEKRLRQLQRNLSRKVKGSNNRKKAKFELAKQHEKVANQRKDKAFKTANYLFSNYDTVVREDLKIKNMIKNHHLAKSISDAGWGIFFNLLDSKAKQTLGKQVIVVDPKYTSQICSNCGQIVKKTLSVRTHKCDCGCTLDRDHNAAINILARGLQSA